MIPSDWTAVASSNVKALKWDAEGLRVRYGDGSEYLLRGVSGEEAESVLHASSVGKALAALRVKGERV